MNIFTFYYDDGELDYEVKTIRDGNEIIVSESVCGRTRGSFWSEPYSYVSNKSFFETVQELIRDHGGYDNISFRRIGSIENW